MEKTHILFALVVVTLAALCLGQTVKADVYTPILNFSDGSGWYNCTDTSSSMKCEYYLNEGNYPCGTLINKQITLRPIPLHSDKITTVINNGVPDSGVPMKTDGIYGVSFSFNFLGPEVTGGNYCYRYSTIQWNRYYQGTPSGSVIITYATPQGCFFYGIPCWIWIVIVVVAFGAIIMKIGFGDKK